MVTMIFIIFLLIVIAQLCRSLVHTLLHHYGGFSEKFNIKNHRFWNPEISWLYKYEFDKEDAIKIENGVPVMKKGVIIPWYDAFHRFNTIELGARDSAIAIPVCLWMNFDWIGCLIVFAGVIIIDIVFFNLGYDKIWR